MIVNGYGWDPSAALYQTQGGNATDPVTGVPYYLQKPADVDVPVAGSSNAKWIAAGVAGVALILLWGSR